MNTVIVYVDEAACALEMLTPLLQSGRGRAPTRWIVVGCAPRITQRISRWGTNSARESWRGKWAGNVFAPIVPRLQAAGDTVMTRVASGPLRELTDALLAQHGAAQVLDARRPKSGADLQPVTGQPPQAAQGVWGHAAVAAAGAGAGMRLAAD